MRKYAVAAVLIGVFVTPAFALVAGPYFVGLNTTTHTCSVVRQCPGRTGFGQRNSSNPAPMTPPVGLSSPSTRSRMIRAAVCQPACG
jgi:hypothetical protein